MPRDIFAEIPLVGGGLEPRTHVESRVRDDRIARDGVNECTIDEIYAKLMPAGSAEERAAMIAHELEAEARHCFAFAPVVELIRKGERPQGGHRQRHLFVERAAPYPDRPRSG